jgi:hypothetical protein
MRLWTPSEFAFVELRQSGAKAWPTQGAVMVFAAERQIFRAARPYAYAGCPTKTPGNAGR